MNRHMVQLVAAVVEAAPGGRVLDGGCGSGGPARRLAEAGCDVLAVDIDLDPGLAGTTERVGSGRVTWRRADLFELSEESPFEAVCLLGVLHYAGSAARVRELLERADRSLARSGVLALCWITDEIPLAGREAFLPSKRLVRDELRRLGYTPTSWWSVDVEHAHGDHGMHRHHLVYGTWIGGRGPG